MGKTEPLLWCPSCNRYKSIILTDEHLGKSYEIIKYGYCEICDCEVEVHLDVLNKFKSINERK